MKYIYLVLLISLLGSCKKDKTKVFNELKTKFHFTPLDGSMNNIVAYFDEYSDGRYLFYNNKNSKNNTSEWKYAATDFDSEWKKDHTNNFHWKDLGVFLNSDDFIDGFLYKDQYNLSKFEPKAGETWVAAYSVKDKGIELAYSTNKGKSFTKYGIVIPKTDSVTYKHPQIDYVSKLDGWCMVVSGNNHLAIFASRDFKNWKKINTIKLPNHKKDDYYEFPTIKDVNMSKNSYDLPPWVLLYSKRNKTTKTSETKYIIGTFDSLQYKPFKQIPKQFSIGNDYGGLIFNDFQNLRELYYSIMKSPYDDFNALSRKKELEVTKTKGEYVLRSNFAGPPWFYNNKQTFKDTISTKNETSFVIEAKEKIENLNITLSNKKDKKLIIGIKDKKLFVDKSNLNGNINEQQSYKTDSIEGYDINSLTIFIDAQLLEITANKGVKCINTFIPINEPFTKIEVIGNKKPLYFCKIKD